MKDSKDFYNKYWSDRKESGNRHRYSVFSSWIKNGAKVLDIGAGDGYLGKLIKDNKNAQVVCLDISEVALTRAKEKGLETVVGDLEKELPFEPKSFDYVIATEIIEHISFSEELLMEMSRVAREYILVSIPNSAHWTYRIQLLFGAFPRQWAFHPREHLRFWSIGDFKKTLSGVGLHAEEIRAGSGRRYLRDWLPNLFALQVCFKIRSK